MDYLCGVNQNLELHGQDTDQDIVAGIPKESGSSGEWMGEDFQKQSVHCPE
ncbi:hypothetical protein GCM10011361_11990 [Muriicola marianensis]|uniref:Uncharacterized protein n=1 Tax=Muriicola marianensis TaxID=1324801 RepID=A0ABQ1QWR1_9FLAO|nr:hypothetical protein GCM10011361_11990 [Muriicola marianensis]